MLRIAPYALVMIFCLLSSLGCDNAKVQTDTDKRAEGVKSEKETILSPTETANQLESALAAKKILNDSSAAYKKLTSYEDAGVLKLRVPLPEKPVEDIERMRIAFEAPNKLAIQALELRSCWSSTTFESIFRSKDVAPYGMQRLVRPRPEKFDLGWLVVDHLQGTLDNPTIRIPLQLQMLFADEPLSMFTTGTAKQSLLTAEKFDSVLCDRVQVIEKNLKWVLWIDQNSKLIRKYEMPLELIKDLVPGLPAGLDESKMELCVEMLGVAQNQKIAWDDWQLPEDKDDLFVSRFIDSPPKLPTMLGKKMEPFDLKNAAGERILDSAQRAKPITILCWVGVDELSELFIKYLLDINLELQKTLPKNFYEIVLVTKSPAKDMVAALKKWNCDFPLAVDTADQATSLFQLTRNPAVVVLDKRSVVQLVDEFGYLGVLPSLLKTLQSEVDPAARTLQQSLDDQSRYVSRLHRAIIDKTQVDKLSPIEPFPFTFHQSPRPDWYVPFESKIIAAGGEQYHAKLGSSESPPIAFSKLESPVRVMTVLDEKGQIFTIDSAKKVKQIATIPMEKANNATRIHVVPEPWNHRWIAIIPEGLPRFWIIDTDLVSEENVQDATEYELKADESPVAFAWTALGEKTSLAVSTDKSRLVVFVPGATKLMSADSSNAIAIVPSLNKYGECVDWSVCDVSGKLTPIGELPSSFKQEQGVIGQLSFVPLKGTWTWGRSLGKPVILAMADLPSGEAGTILQYQDGSYPSSAHPLSVRAEQCRILASTTLKNGSFYWLATSPRRVLHLQTNDNYYRDQMSLGKPILGAAIFPDDANLSMVLAIEGLVSGWTVKIPPPPAAIPTETNQDGTKTDDKSNEATN